MALSLKVLSCRKKFPLLVYHMSLFALAWTLCFRDTFVLAMSSWFFMSALAFFTKDVA